MKHKLGQDDGKKIESIHKVEFYFGLKSVVRQCCFFLSCCTVNMNMLYDVDVGILLAENKY